MGKAALLANVLRARENPSNIPFNYIEQMEHFNFNQHDGKDDAREFYLKPMIIEGTDINNCVLSVSKKNEDVPYYNLQIHTVSGAKMADFILDTWFTIKDEGRPIITNP